MSSGDASQTRRAEAELVAATIIEQLARAGARSRNRLKAMINARFILVESGVRILFMNNDSGLNAVTITLSPLDTYTVVFGTIAGFKFTEPPEHTHTDVHADELFDLFQRTTGLALRL